jgi:hypothetical protein
LSALITIAQAESIKEDEGGSEKKRISGQVDFSYLPQASCTSMAFPLRNFVHSSKEHLGAFPQHRQASFRN